MYFLQWESKILRAPPRNFSSIFTTYDPFLVTRRVAQLFALLDWAFFMTANALLPCFVIIVCIGTESRIRNQSHGEIPSRVHSDGKESSLIRDMGIIHSFQSHAIMTAS